MDFESFFQSWTLVASVITATGAAVAVVWKTVKAGDLFSERIAQRLLGKLDIRQEPIIRRVVAEEIQCKLDNGSELRRTLDDFRAETSVRLDNVERQLENVITQELPVVLALAEKIMGYEST